MRKKQKKNIVATTLEPQDIEIAKKIAKKYDRTFADWMRELILNQIAIEGKSRANQTKLDQN